MGPNLTSLGAFIAAEAFFRGVAAIKRVPRGGFALRMNRAQGCFSLFLHRAKRLSPHAVVAGSVRCAHMNRAAGASQLTGLVEQPSAWFMRR